MPVRVSAPEFEARTDLADWRYLLGRIEAAYRADSYLAAARLVVAIADAAEAAGHHPDVDLRYPDRVHVALTTHAVDGVTDLDLALAVTISGLARQAGARAEPTSSQASEVAIDAMDIDAVRPFWAAVLGYVDAVTPAGEQVVAVVDPARIGPAFWFQQMDQPRPQRNRIHIDVTVPPDVAPDRISAALAAGGRMLTDQYARAFWVLADPEGNEVCVCTSQDRTPRTD